MRHDYCAALLDLRLTKRFARSLLPAGKQGQRSGPGLPG